MINNSDFITADTDTIYEVKKKIEDEFVVSDFGLKIKDRNIFYFLYMKDKLSYRRGLSIMIGDRVIFEWDNNND
jgi:hypothetical protein